MIKTKPIPRVRLTAQDIGAVRKWFRGYKRIVKLYKFKKENTINFDGAGFRIGCPRGEKILVPKEIREVSS